jgi:hypothetical protein
MEQQQRPRPQQQRPPLVEQQQRPRPQRLVEQQRQPLVEQPLLRLTS